MGNQPQLTTKGGHPIRKCYVRAVQRYERYVATKRPLLLPGESYLKWNDWCAGWRNALLSNRNRAVKEAQARREEEKRCRRQRKRR